MTLCHTDHNPNTVPHSRSNGHCAIQPKQSSDTAIQSEFGQCAISPQQMTVPYSQRRVHTLSHRRSRRHCAIVTAEFRHCATSSQQMTLFVATGLLYGPPSLQYKSTGVFFKPVESGWGIKLATHLNNCWIYTSHLHRLLPELLIMFMRTHSK